MRYVYPALVVLAGGCFSPPVEAPKTTVEQATTVPVNTTIKEEVDLLFVIDDSGSMAPKQDALKSRFPALINVLDQFAASGHKASYHIGVVTSDLGAPGINCGSNLGGKLQQRGLAKTNTAGCVGPVGANFIDYDQRSGTDNFTSTGQTLAETFSCMATVVDPDGTVGGHTGCGFESQLEAAYKALHDANTIPENKGFLRDEAILAVVWITDEHDCSVDPGSDLFETADNKYGAFSSFRCAQYGIVCDGMLLPSMPPASFAHCAPAKPSDGGKLTNLDKYVNFYASLKKDPNDVILAAITAPKDPVATITVSGQALCGSAGGSCTNIAHSCVAADNPAFFGDPSVRLSYVVEKAASHQLTSICDGDYTPALQGVADKIRNRLTPACMKSPIADPAHPDCTVEDVAIVDGLPKRTSLPNCTDVGGATPCWRLCNASDPTNAAGCTPAQLTNLTDNCAPVCNPQDKKVQLAAVTIDRGSTPPTGGSTAEVACNTIAIANEDPNAACQ